VEQVELDDQQTGEWDIPFGGMWITPLSPSRASLR
jgi:hypothetical protein